MSAKTRERDVDLDLAVQYYNGHSPNVTYRQAAQLFYVNPTTLYQRQKDRQHSISNNGGHNQILNDMQRKAILQYVKDQHTVGLSCSTPMVLSAICHLCDQEDPPQQHPSIRYVKDLMKSLPELHKIKCKPLDYKRRAAQDTDAVQEWYHNYTCLLEQHKIPPTNIFNFDETNAREGCPGAYNAWVPIGVTEVSYLL